MMIRKPEELHVIRDEDGAAYLYAGELAELLRIPVGVVTALTPEAAKKRRYAYRPGYRSAFRTVIRADACGDLIAAHWDMPHREWRAYIQGLMGGG